MPLRIIGAGLAGSEAAWQAASMGVEVKLYEMRPLVMTKAHKTSLCAELVCSNSFRGAELSHAVGLLKEELKLLGSLIFQAAEYAKVPAGTALAVDRQEFSQYVDDKVRSHPLITVHPGEVPELFESSPKEPLIIAAGPLCSQPLVKSIEQLTGQGSLSFFDAISPIVLSTSIDREEIFFASRYDKGEGEDYMNLPLSEYAYSAFVEQVHAAEKFGGHDEVESDNIENSHPFEGCMPIEDMIARGPEVLRFGPLKSAGLIDPKTRKRPYAVVQLRRDDNAGKLWSMVGMQTRMKHGEQKRIFSSLPGLANAEFVRLGSVHRNTFLDSPKFLNQTLEARNHPGLFFAGQITGVEGYVESTAAGLLAGLNSARLLLGKPLLSLPTDTASGALFSYISDPSRTEFQPMNINFGLMPGYLDSMAREQPGRKLGKRERRARVSREALEALEQFMGRQ